MSSCRFYITKLHHAVIKLSSVHEFSGSEEMGGSADKFECSMKSSTEMYKFQIFFLPAVHFFQSLHICMDHSHYSSPAKPRFTSILKKDTLGIAVYICFCSQNTSLHNEFNDYRENSRHEKMQCIAFLYIYRDAGLLRGYVPDQCC